MPEVVNGINALDFDPPVWFGTRVTEDDGEDYIELYETREKAIAQTVPRCLPLGLEKSSVQIGSWFTDFDDRDHLLFYFMAHEFFHVLQNERPFFDPETCANIPGWIKEGTATAVGHEAARRKYPDLFPEKRDDRVAGNFSGLRRYDKPLNLKVYKDGKEELSGAMINYRTSSFWRHLAEVHYKGRYDFLESYMDNPNVGDSWVGWLRQNIKRDTDEELGMVWGGFLADYTGWSDTGYPGEYFKRKDWLEESFGGCETLYLNRTDAADYVEFDLLPLTGNCIQVHVTALGPDGIQEGESAAIQIAAVIMSGSPAARGGLHLGLASSNDKKRFHCAKEAKKSQGGDLGKCLFVPDDGKIRLGGSPQDARVWNVIAQEKGDPQEDRHESAEGKGELINLYTIGYTPTTISMRDAGYNSSEPVSVRIYFVLDIAKIELEGNQPGAVGSLLQGGDPQTTLPKVNASGSAVNSYSKPDQFQVGISTPAGMALPPQAVGKLSHFFISPTADNATSKGNSVLVYMGDVDHGPLGIGETGTFSVGFSASIDGAPAVGFPASPSEAPGQMTVHEFSELVFRASFSGRLCRLFDVETDKELAKTKPCRNPVPVSGDIVKAFAGSRLPGYHMVTERTEGTEMYRKAAERGMAEWSTGGPPVVGGPGDSSGPPGNSSSRGDAINDCACTCEERAETIRRGEAMKAGNDAGEAVNAGELMGLMRCESQCRSEYVMCAMDEAEEQKAQREKEKEQAMKDLENSGECNCSCDYLKGLEGELEKLVQGMQSGNTSAMSQMEKLGRCMSVCESEMMRCATE